MPDSAKTQKPGETEPFDFSLATKRQLRAERKELALVDSETLAYQFRRMQDRIKWDALRQASTEDQVNAALSDVDDVTRGGLPNAAAILATVRDPDYPKLRPIRFLANSCALGMRNKPKSGDVYSPRYSRDVCYKERNRRGPEPKPVTNREYWLGQARSGQQVPTRYLPWINRELAKEKRSQRHYVKTANLTYTDIPEKMESMKKKKRTTIWLPETTLEKLKNLSASTGAPMAELFRRAVEAYLKSS